MADTRLPEDRQECQPGGMIGLEGTPYAGWAVLRELDGSYTLLHDGTQATGGYATVGAALDQLDALRSAEGLKPAEDA